MKYPLEIVTVGVPVKPPEKNYGKKCEMVLWWYCNAGRHLTGMLLNKSPTKKTKYKSQL